MISAEIKRLLEYAGESHQAARTLIDGGFAGFSAAQSYYTMFYLAEAVLLSVGLTFSSHAAVIAAFGKEFVKTGLLDPKFHRHLIIAQKRRESGHHDANHQVSEDQAFESLQWAGEFKLAVEEYLSKN